MITEEQADKFTFDVLDATKIVPEELVPVMPVGRLILNRNPDNFFAETEQVAFCTAHVVPGIDFSNDPLLAGRIHSYVDTQISRLGGPNFHEMPINAPLAQVHNNQRDGMHRQTIHRGRVAYEPNSLGGGCPFQAGKMGFVSFPEPMARADRQGARQAGAVRRSLHAGDAVLQQPDAGRAAAHHQRVPLRAVEGAGAGDSRAHGLGPDERGHAARARRSPKGLGIDEMPEPMPKVLQKKVEAGGRAVEGVVAVRAARRWLHPHAARRDHRRRRRSRREVEALAERLASEGAVPIVLGVAAWTRASPIAASRSRSARRSTPRPRWCSTRWCCPTATAAAAALAKNGRVLEFLKDHYRHCKPILVLGASTQVLRRGRCAGDAAERQTRSWD